MFLFVITGQQEKGCTLPFLGGTFLLLLLLLFLIPSMYESYSMARNKLMT
jgi:hypothetical protein